MSTLNVGNLAIKKEHVVKRGGSEESLEQLQTDAEAIPAEDVVERSKANGAIEVEDRKLETTQTIEAVSS